MARTSFSYQILKSSCLDKLLFVIDLGVKLIEVSDEEFPLERQRRCLVLFLFLLETLINLGPFIVQLNSALWVLLHQVFLLLRF